MDNSDVDAFAVEAGLVDGPWAQSTWLEASLAAVELGLRPDDAVLDAPCGTGRHAFALAQLGMRVTAVDLDAASIRLAQQSASHPRVQYGVGGLQTMRFAQQFDAIVSFFSCLGYLHDDGAERELLAALVSGLKPGGGFLLSTANPRVACAAGTQRTSYEAGGYRIERADTYDAHSGILERAYETQHIESGVRRSLVHRRRLYTPDEARLLLAAAGIGELRCLGDYAGGAFHEDGSPHAIYIGRRES
jgi:SAM-dependent methyltransferase